MIITVGTAQVVAASGRESRLQHGEPPDPGAGRGRQEGLPSQTNMFLGNFFSICSKNLICLSIFLRKFLC